MTGFYSTNDGQQEMQSGGGADILHGRAEAPRLQALPNDVAWVARDDGTDVCPVICSDYQTRQTFSDGLTMGWPALQPKAWANSGIFTTTPLMRY